MTIRIALQFSIVLTAALLAPPSAFGDAGGQGPGGDAKRGEYVFDAAGCGGCHTDPGRRGKNPRPKGAPLASGQPIVTAFGTFYVPNITPDPDHGIGGWTFDDFDRALRQGRSPSGNPYYPSFPYPSYTLMADRDVADPCRIVLISDPADCWTLLSFRPCLTVLTKTSCAARFSDFTLNPAVINRCQHSPAGLPAYCKNCRHIAGGVSAIPPATR